MHGGALQGGHVNNTQQMQKHLISVVLGVEHMDDFVIVHHCI